jgi:hypothetical protein
MAIRPIPNSNLTYYLLNYDKDGNEVAERDGMLSPKLLQQIKSEPVTDIFIMSHGWRGDVDAAKTQYDNWMGNLLSVTADVEQAKHTRPGFLPLFVGLHWPSEPWGDEDPASFALAASGALVKALVNQFAARLGDKQSIRNNLEVIAQAYVTTDDPQSLPDNVRIAYQQLDKEVGLGVGDDDAPPGDDRPEFDPEDIFQAARQEDDIENFADFSFGDLLAPARVMSFWRMKKRAEIFGSGGARRLLEAISQAAGAKKPSIHLMGHSFGCIVVSAMACGLQGSAIIPVRSVVLVQGALSLWAYCASIPKKKNKAGFFNRLLRENRVLGPIVTTQSEHDRAVGTWYPLAAGSRRQIVFALDLPKYGGVGTFGIQGLEASTVNRKMGSAQEDYQFQPGRIYNLESSDYIRTGGGFSGAHSDIVHPEIAHVIWRAASVPPAG